MALLGKVLVIAFLLSAAQANSKNEKKDDELFDFFNDDDDEFFSESKDDLKISESNNEEDDKKRDKKFRDNFGSEEIFGGSNRKEKKFDGGEEKEIEEVGHDFYGVPSNKDTMYGPYSFLTDELRPKFPKIPDPPKRKYRPTTEPPQPPQPPVPPPPQPPVPPPPQPSTTKAPPPPQIPPKQESQRVQSQERGRPYAFAYGVNDASSGTSFNQAETSDGNGGTTGQYKVHLPDGRIQTVNYMANKNGYQANIIYDGEARTVGQPPTQPSSSPPPQHKAQRENNLNPTPSHHEAPHNQHQQHHVGTSKHTHDDPSPGPISKHDTQAPSQVELSTNHHHKQNMQTSQRPPESNQYNVLTDKVVESSPQKFAQEQSQERGSINTRKAEDRSLVNQPGPPYQLHSNDDNQNHPSVQTQLVEEQETADSAATPVDDDEGHSESIVRDNKPAKTNLQSQLPAVDNSKLDSSSTEVYKEFVTENQPEIQITAGPIQSQILPVNNIKQPNNPASQIFLSSILVPPVIAKETSLGVTVQPFTTTTTATEAAMPITTLKPVAPITPTFPLQTQADNSKSAGQSLPSGHRQAPQPIVQLSIGSLPGDGSPRYNPKHQATALTIAPTTSATKPNPTSQVTISSRNSRLVSAQGNLQVPIGVPRDQQIASTTHHPVTGTTHLIRPAHDMNYNSVQQRTLPQTLIGNPQTTTPQSRSPHNYRVDLHKPINISPGPAYTTHRPQLTNAVAAHSQFGAKIQPNVAGGPQVSEKNGRNVTYPQNDNISRRPRHVSPTITHTDVQMRPEEQPPNNLLPTAARPSTSFNPAPEYSNIPSGLSTQPRKETSPSEQTEIPDRPASLTPILKNLPVSNSRKSVTPLTNYIPHSSYTQRPQIHISSTLPAKYRTFKPLLSAKVQVFGASNITLQTEPPKIDENAGKEQKDVNPSTGSKVISGSEGGYVSFIAGRVGMSSPVSDVLKTSDEKIPSPTTTEPVTETHFKDNPVEIKQIPLNIPQPTLVQRLTQPPLPVGHRKKRSVVNSSSSPKVRSRAHASLENSEQYLPQLGRQDSTARPTY
ncbi:proteoglycan 4-like [Hyalella azteca]|uniref:Proteoglycan 4-like n=1 Tax=Hyalella azteca TaxID=294128 RepID=A0A8B7PGM0_HYAAZ|nr:proteoglycan 4-like [Hyalella azteca]